MECQGLMYAVSDYPLGEISIRLEALFIFGAIFDSLNGFLKINRSYYAIV